MINLELLVSRAFCIAINNLVEVKNELGHFAKWHELGLQLGLTYSQLEVIESDKGSNNERLAAVLSDWLRMNYNTAKYGLPSWSSLAAALEQIDGALAKTIKERHA